MTAGCWTPFISTKVFGTVWARSLSRFSRSLRQAHEGSADRWPRGGRVGHRQGDGYEACAGDRREAAAHRLASWNRKAATSKTSTASSSAPAPTRISTRLESSPLPGGDGAEGPGEGGDGAGRSTVTSSQTV